MYGRVMSLNDEAMPDWFRLASGLGPDRVREHLAALEAGSLLPWRPSACSRAPSSRASTTRPPPARAEEEFLRVHRRRELPTEIAEAAAARGRPGVPARPARRGARDRLELGGTAADRGRRRQARRRAVTGLELPRDELAGRVLQVGRRRFVRFSGKVAGTGLTRGPRSCYGAGGRSAGTCLCARISTQLHPPDPPSSRARGVEVPRSRGRAAEGRRFDPNRLEC